jgi:hypothetical protein
MGLPFRFFGLHLIFTFCITLNISGQITAIGANKKVAYKESIKDFAYFYSQVSGPKNGLFRAVSPKGGNATFEWSILDSVSPYPYNVLLKEDSVLTSEITSNSRNGYRLRITNAAGFDTTYYFWFFKNNISFKLKKDKDGYVPQLNSFCDYVDLEYDSVKITELFRYYNTEKNKWDTLKNAVKDTAAVSPASDISVNQKETIKNLVRIMNPPIEESEFTCIVRDLFGAETSDKVDYKPIRVEAKINKKIITDRFNNIPENDISFIIDGSKDEYSPVTAELANETKNAETFVWYMGDGDTIETQTLEEKVTHTYYLSDGTASKEYKIWLVASNDFGCIDSTSETVKVTEPKITVPNVFTPNEDEANKYFVIKTASIKYFKITIYSKSGKIVYKDEGPDIYRFKWDGKIMHTSTDAKPGIYYYTLVYQIWDKTSSIDKNKVSHGFIYLYR